MRAATLGTTTDRSPPSRRGELLPLASKLEVLFKLRLLVLVGIDRTRIAALVASNRKLRWLLDMDQV